MSFISLGFGLLRRVLGLLLAATILTSPVTGIISKNKDNPIISEKKYIAMMSELIEDLICEGNGTLLADPTEETVRKIINAIVVQFIMGEEENDNVTDALNEIPHEDYPHDTETQWDENIIEKSIKALLDGENSILPDDIASTLRNLASGVNDLHIYFVDTKYAGTYELCGSYLDDSGNCMTVSSGMYYDSTTGMVYGKDNNGVFGIGYDFDAKRYVLISPTKPWQRIFGFNIAYDIAGDIIFTNCDTVRIKFDYQNREHMVQFWKGNYTTLSNGAEIGLYVQNEKIPFHYDAVDEDGQLKMSMTLSADDKIILSNSSQSHWWLAAFKVGPAIDKEKMVLDFEIDFGNDEYAKAFCDAAAENGIATEITGSVVKGIF